MDMVQTVKISMDGGMAQDILALSKEKFVVDDYCRKKTVSSEMEPPKNNLLSRR